MDTTRPRTTGATAVIAVVAALFAFGGGEPPKKDVPEDAKIKAETPTKPVRKPTATKVVSTDKSREGKRPSEFLQPPGTGRYDDNPVEWRDVPPWRQASFFGVRAEGRFFVYVVDCSGSMDYELRLARAKDAIRQSVARLQEPQRFKVIFYNSESLAMPGDLTHSADLSSKNRLFAWMRRIDADGDTDPRSSMDQAISLRPDAIFLLSDGAFPEGTVEHVAKKNTRKTPIHCVDLSGGEAGDQLKRIAGQSGGKYASRPLAQEP